MRAADVVAKRLYEEGCRWAFGMPGGEVLTLVDALEEAGITFVLCKHENAAGFMAEGTYHRTGAPGILVATVGPGALNGINVVENARQDRVPLVVLTGCVDAETAEVYTHQVLEQREVFRPITKASTTLTAGAAHVQIDKLLGIATEGQPGPVHIDVPISVADAPASGEGVLRPKASPVAPVGPDLDRAQAALATAQRPVILAGVDAMAQNAGDAVRHAAEQLGAPVITTYKAKGLIPEDHPLALGGAGLSPKADGILLPFLAKADVILCLGYDPIEMRIGWRDPWNTATQTVIDVTAVPNHHYMHHATINIVGDVAASCRAVLPSDAREDVWSDAAPAATRTAMHAAFRAPDAWGPARVMATCQAKLPYDTLATADSGAHRILLSQIWRCDFPRALTQSSALCTMGCAVPLAMGAQIVEPNRTVVSFSGDAGFLMVAGELATAAEQGLRTLFVVFVDASLALIELKQRQRQMPNRGVDFGRADFAAMGRAFGGQGHRVTNVAELEAALEAAQQSETFTVIAAEIDRKSYDGTF